MSDLLFQSTDLGNGLWELKWWDRGTLQINGRWVGTWILHFDKSVALNISRKCLTTLYVKSAWMAMTQKVCSPVSCFSCVRRFVSGHRHFRVSFAGLTTFAKNVLYRRYHVLTPKPNWIQLFLAFHIPSTSFNSSSSTNSKYFTQTSKYLISLPKSAKYMTKI